MTADIYDWRFGCSLQ